MAIGRRIWLFLLGPALALAAVALAGWFAWRHEPEFYGEALAQPVEQQRQSSDEMLARTTALLNQARNEPKFAALLTAEQINGWLAVDLAENHPELLPDDVHDPRVAIHPGEATIAWRQKVAATSTVVSVRVDVFVGEQNELGVRIRGARAGAAPLPVGSMLDDLAAAARDTGLLVRIGQQQGDPVLLVSLDSIPQEGSTQYLLDHVELREGEIFLSGHARARGRAVQAGENEKRQP